MPVQKSYARIHPERLQVADIGLEIYDGLAEFPSETKKTRAENRQALCWDTLPSGNVPLGKIILQTQCANIHAEIMQRQGKPKLNLKYPTRAIAQGKTYLCDFQDRF
jgi:hypothetical protein